MLIIQNITMNNIEIKVYEKLLRKICEKYRGEKKITNDRIKEIFSHEKLSAEEVIYFSC